MTNNDYNLDKEIEEGLARAEKMLRRKKRVIVAVIIGSVTLLVTIIFGIPSLIAPVQPTLTPTATSTKTHLPPTATLALTNTPIATSTTMSTPKTIPILLSDCNPGVTITGEIDENIPAHLDILNASSTLSGTTLTVVFTVREIPDEIIINNNNLENGSPEIAWGVAVDVDNNPSTGGSVYLVSGHGYEYVLQAFSFKNGIEQTTSIDNWLWTDLWEVQQNGDMQSGRSGTFEINRLYRK